MRPTPPPRLSLVRAERAPIAVIFRRGPSKRVEVIKWDFTRDGFERGHWFHGRIYEKRSHLSPDGELLVYFASKFTRQSISDDEYTYAWTAVSRPPWLTALALWPKGDCWHGGGIFRAKRTLWLNHKPEVATPHPSHRPVGLKVVENPGACGEDEPVYKQRLDRDGWVLRQAWATEWQGLSHGFRTVQPDVRVKHQQPGTDSIAIVLQRRIDNLSYREHFRFDGTSSEPEMPPGPLDWLDWDSHGRLIALSGGRVWAAVVVDRHVQRFTELIDLRDDRPEEREPPASARIW